MLLRRGAVLGAFVGVVLVGLVVGPPVTENKKKGDKGVETNEIDSQGFEVEYKRYLQEVVNVLESDDTFRDKLMKADPDDIKSGAIASHLSFVNHNVRSKLDELKRQEMERLRQAAVRNYEMAHGVDKKHMKIPQHLDHGNPSTFEEEDLKKLILQTTKELEDVDRRRKEEFKEYEMQKELTYEEQLKRMDEKNRAAAETYHKEQEEKHKKHVPMHHPGSKQQLEEVWEEQDHQSPEDFNPKTFFLLHDLDGNGVWDANEVKALFKKELDKVYDPNAPEDDIRERVEEMERMREHVFNETDTNHDQLISYQEFLDYTRRPEYQKDEGWDSIDNANQPLYSQDEYKQYVQQHEAEIRRMMDQGLIPPAPPGYVPMVLPPGAQVPPGYDVHPGSQQQLQQHNQQNQHQQQQQHMPPPGMHPQAMGPGGGGYHPQQGQGQHFNQQYAHGQDHQYGYHPQQGQAYHPDQHQQQQYHPPPQHQIPQQHQQQQQQHQQQQLAYQQPPPPNPNQQQQHQQYQAAPPQIQHQPPHQQQQQQHQQQQYQQPPPPQQQQQQQQQQNQPPPPQPSSSQPPQHH